MYSILISVAVALLVGASGLVFDVWGWTAAVLVTLLTLVLTWVLLSRRLVKRLQPAMDQIRKQAEAGRLEMALRGLHDVLPMGRWVPGLTGQLHAQMALLAHHSGKKEEAAEHFAKATRRSAEAQMMRAAMEYRAGHPDQALEILRVASPFNRRHAMLHNFQAWLLYREGKLDDAIASLNRFVTKYGGDEISNDNLLRLQNRKRMDMKSFSMEWYALGIERPPAHMGQMRTGRKGFRNQRR